jgi:response regulator RpfG family c-di-GMP phosphodiesterase
MIRVESDGRPKLLLVDDEARILQALADLCVMDFDVFGVTSGQEALVILEAEDIAVLVADQRMPRMQGSELLTNAAVLRPDTTRILLTGFSDIDAVVEAVNQGKVYHYVTKPWNPEALVTLLRAAAERHHIVTENRRLLEALAEDRLDPTSAQTLSASASAAERALLLHENSRLQHLFSSFHDSHWHLTKLQEVLPICMGCGMVRNEEGRWITLPAFLQRNASFLSHGYCPVCEPAEDTEEDA